ncbi:MAG: DNA polymerase III subunit delta' [Pikeienuella sp.]
MVHYPSALAPMSDDAPAPDRVGDAPHPLATHDLFGQSAAEQSFLEAWSLGRLHHAWLLTGPRGVGKATLAYRMARTRLAHADEGDDGGMFGAPPPPNTLSMDPDHPVMRRMLAGAEPRLFTLRRSVNEKTGKLNTVIRVDDVRRLKDFFQMSAADGGWRVAVLDAADEMNPAAQNAVLKFLEEPPAKTMLILISHAPARLLPTIRSRCRTLALGPLSASDLASALSGAGITELPAPEALAALTGGSAGEAVRLMEGNGPQIYGQIVKLLSGAPGMDRPTLIRLADACAGRDAEARYDLTWRLLMLALSRLARAGALGAPQTEAAMGEAAMIARLAPDVHAARIWADTIGEVENRAARARAVNLDPAQVMLDTFFEIDAAARKARAA